MAARHDLYIDQGTTFTRDFIYKGSDGTPIDLTGFTAQMMIRKTATAASPAVLDVAPTITALEGKITLSLTDEVTSALPAPFSGVYDLELTDGSGTVTRLVQGRVTIDPGVTR
jgi:hypothetical protein